MSTLRIFQVVYRPSFLCLNPEMISCARSVVSSKPGSNTVNLNPYRPYPGVLVTTTFDDADGETAADDVDNDRAGARNHDVLTVNYVS